MKFLGSSYYQGYKQNFKRFYEDMCHLWHVYEQISFIYDGGLPVESKLRCFLDNTKVCCALRSLFIIIQE